MKILLEENERRPLTPSHRADLPPISSPHFLLLFPSPSTLPHYQNKIGFALVWGLGKARTALAERRGEQGVAAGGAPGPPNRAGDEPARGGSPAAASPRLAARERVGRGGGGGEPAGLLAGG